MTDPHGLDYQAAYEAMYPGLQGSEIRVQDLSDHALKVVDRAARLRLAERERVKAEFSGLATALESEEIGSTAPGVKDEIADRIRKLIEEIR
jgi:hypothetical protein